MGRELQIATNPETQDEVVIWFDYYRDRLVYSMNRRDVVEVPHRIRVSCRTYFEMGIKLLREEMTWEDRLQCEPDRRGAD